MKEVSSYLGLFYSGSYRKQSNPMFINRELDSHRNELVLSINGQENTNPLKHSQ